MAFLNYARSVTIVLFVAAIASLLQSQRGYAQEPAGEYEIKAAFLLNFVRFTEWPAEAFTDSNQPIVVGIYGRDPFGPRVIADLKGKIINGRPLTVHILGDKDEVTGCQVLFVPAADGGSADAIERSRKRNVLTIGESADFLQIGGMIRLFLEQNKVRFEVNLPRTESASLKVSAKLLGVAARVYR